MRVVTAMDSTTMEERLWWENIEGLLPSQLWILRNQPPIGLLPFCSISPANSARNGKEKSRDLVTRQVGFNPDINDRPSGGVESLRGGGPHLIMNYL